MIPAQPRIRPAVLAPALFSIVCVLLSGGYAQAQSPDEHASHHPGAAPVAGAMPRGASSPAGAMPAGAAGMMEQMGEMMKSMGQPPRKELYPSLMALPELTPEKRLEVEQHAAERMHAGGMLMTQALDKLHAGVESGDYAAMQAATALLREGTAQLEAGIAARRALAEGQAPREIALAWFKREMSLAPPTASEQSHGVRGLSVLHLFTMALLIAFAFAMLAMYFFKMRRAAALFGRIDPGIGSPPPGSSPSLGGSPGPTGPPGGKTPPIGSSPSPKAQAAADSPAPRSAPDLKSTPPDAPGQSPTSPAPSEGKSFAPMTAKWAGRLRVESIVTETPSVQTFRLRFPGGGALPFTFLPGQFLNLAFGIGGARMTRSYSISSSPNERDYLDLTVKREERGAVSRHIVDLLTVGDEIEAGGPVGKFTFNGTEADSVVLIGAGVGITPMMSVARYLSEQSWPGEIYFIYGCRAPEDLIFAKAIAALERSNPQLHVVMTMSKPTPEWKGPRGRITKDFLVGAIPGLASRRAQLCGPPGMMDAIKTLLTEIGVSPGNLKTEAFGAVKPAPAAPGTSAKSTAAATGPLVTFSKNHKSARIGTDQSGEQAALATGPGQTILELSEELGIGIDFSCRIGTCGVCKVKMTAGEVDMAIDDALDDDDKNNGIILACQAKPKPK